MAEECLWGGPGTGRGLLPERPARGVGAAQLRQKHGAGLLGKRDGHWLVARHVRQFDEVPDGHASDLPPNATDVRLHDRGRNAFLGSHQRGVAQEDQRGAGGEVGEELRVERLRVERKSAVCLSTLNSLSLNLPRAESQLGFICLNPVRKQNTSSGLTSAAPKFWPDSSITRWSASARPRSAPNRSAGWREW